MGSVICEGVRLFTITITKISHVSNRWHQEYLVDLREQHKIVEGRAPSIMIGDMVLLKEDNVKRQLWKWVS